MNYNQIQALLEKLPDQQIMAYAQGSNPQVPQVLAQMEAMRRENLRKSETMQTPGMKKGGIVRGYNKGGPVESYRRVQEAQEKLLESRKRKLNPDNTPNPNKGRLGRMGDQIVEEAKFIAGMPMGLLKSGIGLLMPDSEQEATQKEQPSMAPPAEMPQQRVDPNAVPPAAMPQQRVDPNQTPPAAMPQARGPAAVAPAATANPKATPDVLAKINQATEAQTDKFAQEYQAIFADRAALREGERSAAPDADLDRKQAFYYALAKFGATLATTGVWAQAGDVGLETFRGEMEKSKARQEAFRKESLDIGLNALDDKLAMMGVKEKERAAMRAEAQNIFENSMKERQVKAQEDQVRNTYAIQKGQLANQSMEIKQRATSAGIGALGAKPMTWEAALKKAEEERKNDPRLRDKGTLESRAMELMRADPARTGKLTSPGGMFGLDPSAIDAELARRSGS